MREIEQELPAIVGLTESVNPQQRGNALSVLYAIAARQKVGSAENLRQMDLQAANAIVPYIPRLASKLTDP